MTREKAPMKKIGIVLGILVILVLLVAVLAPFLIDLNQYKETILSNIRPHVPREVDFEHIELTVLSGLGAELRGLRVADNPAFSTDDFIALEGMQVRVMILPLLKGQVKVKKIILKRPVIRLARNAQGALSFSDLLGDGKPSASDEGGAQDEETVAPDPGSRPEADDAGPGLLAGLLVNEFSIQKGKVIYRDEMLWPGQRPLVIDALDVDVRDLALDRSVSIRMAADLLEGAGQNFALSGTVGPVGENLLPEAVPFDLQTSLNKLQLGTVVSLLGSETPLRIRTGTGSVRWEAKGSLGEQIVSQGEVELRDLRWEAEGAEQAMPSESSVLRCKVTQKSVLEMAKEKLVIESLEISLNGERLQMQGVVESFQTDPAWEAKVWSEGFRPDLLVGILPLTGQALPAELRFQGPVVLHLESRGTRETFGVEARLDMEGMGLEYGDFFRKPSGGTLSIRCKADKKEERVTVRDLELLLHSLTMNTSGEMILSNTPHFGFLVETNPVALEGWDTLFPLLAPYEPTGSLLLRSSLRGTPEDASVNLQVSSDSIGFLFPPGEGEEGAEEDRSGLLQSCNIKVQAKKKSNGLFGDAQGSIKSGRLMDVPFERLLASLKYSPEAFDISGVEVKVFQGEVQGTGRYDLEEQSWNVRPSVRDVALGEVLDRLTEYKGDFTGSFRGKFAASGRAVSGAATDVTAQGSFRVSEGELKNFDLVGSITDTLFGLKGIEQRLKSRRGEIRQHETTRFDWLEGAFRLNRGILNLEGLQLRNVGTSKATDSDALLEGTVDLEKQRLDLKGKVILSKRHSAELAAEAEVMKALYNAEQRIVLPITLKGITQKPVPFLDTEYVLGAVSRYYARQGVQKLREQIGLPAEKREDEEKPGERLLRELFKKR
jgi:hypothetical protein